MQALRRPRFVDFKLNREDAADAVKKWLPTLAPTAIKKALAQQQPTRAFLPFWTYEVQVESRTMPQKERRKERQSRRREKKREIKREGGRKSGGTSKEVKR